MSSPTEVWKPIKHFEMYEVSDLGKIKSLDRFSTKATYNRFYKGRVLKSTIGSSGYETVVLSKLGKWRATAYLNSKIVYMGYFKTELEAYSARVEFKNKHK